MIKIMVCVYKARGCKLGYFDLDSVDPQSIFAFKLLHELATLRMTRY